MKITVRVVFMACTECIPAVGRCEKEMPAVILFMAIELFLK